MYSAANKGDATGHGQPALDTPVAAMSSQPTSNLGDLKVPSLQPEDPAAQQPWDMDDDMLGDDELLDPLKEYV